MEIAAGPILINWKDFWWLEPSENGWTVWETWWFLVSKYYTWSLLDHFSWVLQGGLVNWLIQISTLDTVLGTGSKRRRRQSLAILIREGEKTHSGRWWQCLWRKLKQGEGRRIRWCTCLCVQGVGVSVLNRLSKEGLSDLVTSSRNLNIQRKWATQISRIFQAERMASAKALRKESYRDLLGRAKSQVWLGSSEWGKENEKSKPQKQAERHDVRTDKAW